MPLRTRPLTGLPSWPITLLAGVEKSGKTYGAIAASASPLIHRTFLVTLGEDQPEEYAKVPGQRVEVVEHEGTYRDVMRALTDAAAEPADGTRPNLLILDSGTRLWNLLSGMAQDSANARPNAKGPTGEKQITMDLWNTAASRWENIVDTLREHQGPSIVTARLDLVAVLDGRGTPTGEKTWKVQAHKSLPYDVGAIIELREPAKPGRPAPAILRGVRSLSLRAEDTNRDGEAEFRTGLTLDSLWHGMGLDGVVGQRTHSAVHISDPEPAARPEAPQRPQEAPPRQQRQQPPAPAPLPGLDGPSVRAAILSSTSRGDLKIRLMAVGAADDTRGWHRTDLETLEVADEQGAATTAWDLFCARWMDLDPEVLAKAAASAPQQEDTVDAELVEDDTAEHEPQAGSEHREATPKADPARRHPAVSTAMSNVRAAAARHTHPTDSTEIVEEQA